MASGPVVLRVEVSMDMAEAPAVVGEVSFSSFGLWLFRVKLCALLADGAKSSSGSTGGPADKMGSAKRGRISKKKKKSVGEKRRR